MKLTAGSHDASKLETGLEKLLKKTKRCQQILEGLKHSKTAKDSLPSFAMLKGVPLNPYCCYLQTVGTLKKRPEKGAAVPAVCGG